MAAGVPWRAGGVQRPPGGGDARQDGLGAGLRQGTTISPNNLKQKFRRIVLFIREIVFNCDFCLFSHRLTRPSRSCPSSSAASQGQRPCARGSTGKKIKFKNIRTAKFQIKTILSQSGAAFWTTTTGAETAEEEVRESGGSQGQCLSHSGTGRRPSEKIFIYFPFFRQNILGIRVFRSFLERHGGGRLSFGGDRLKAMWKREFLVSFLK